MLVKGDSKIKESGGVPENMGNGERRGGQMAERLGSRAVNQRVVG